MRCHAVMGHRPPRMVLRRRLRKPYVARITCKLATFERANDGVPIAEFATRRVHKVCAALEVFQGLIVDHMLGFGMKRAVQRDNVAGLREALKARVMCK